MHASQRRTEGGKMTHPSRYSEELWRTAFTVLPVATGHFPLAKHTHNGCPGRLLALCLSVSLCVPLTPSLSLSLLDIGCGTWHTMAAQVGLSAHSLSSCVVVLDRLLCYLQGSCHLDIWIETYVKVFVLHTRHQ
jgi:hypothetical protein